MKSKKFKVGAVAMALVFAMSGSAFAAGGSPAGGTPGSPSDAEYAKNADTVFSIFSSSQNAGNMSYTIPLYVTMGVSQGKAEVAVPKNYGIINNSKDATTEAPMNIGVTSIQFEKLPGSFYQTVTSVDGKTSAAAIQLSIGGVNMPARDKEGFDTIKIDGTHSGVFWDTTGTKVKAIAPSTALFDVPIVGKVVADVSPKRDEKKAAAQFRVKYSVSLLTKDGEPLGSVYAGSDYHQAGLDDKTDGTPGWDVDTPSGGGSH